jgi:hypothetical protein
MVSATLTIVNIDLVTARDLIKSVGTAMYSRRRMVASSDSPFTLRIDMDLRLLASAFCGAALTLAVVSFASASRPQSQCTVDLADTNARLSAIEKNLATIPTLASDISKLQAAPGSTTAQWQSDITQKLDRLESDLLDFQYQSTLRH